MTISMWIRTSLNFWNTSAVFSWNSDRISFSSAEFRPEKEKNTQYIGTSEMLRPSNYRLGSCKSFTLANMYVSTSKTILQSKDSFGIYVLASHVCYQLWSSIAIWIGGISFFPILDGLILPWHPDGASHLLYVRRQSYQPVMPPPPPPPPPYSSHSN